MKKNVYLTIVFAIFSLVSVNANTEATLWSEDFEGDWTANWHADAGTWEAGIPTSGPIGANSGDKCAATVLDGNYTEPVSSRLIRHTSFTVPAALQNPRLRFWHWYSLSSGDYGKVQIKVVGTTDWVDVSTTYTSTGSNIWTYPSIDLSDYAGKSIEIAFYFYSINTSFGNVSSGWYIDDIEVVTGSIAFNNPEDWESGIGDWASERGTWEVGAPSSGPGSAHNGIQCAATVLDGNYAEPVSSKLISPVYTVPSASQNPRLRFWHWYSLSSGDYGKVQIKVVGTTDWVDVSTTYTSTGSNIWTYPSIDLSDYAGKSIEIAFYFYSINTSFGNVSSGWYIDDIEVVTGSIAFNNPEDWESGIGDWASERGTWEVGAPSSGPGSAHNGIQCAATVLDGNYAEPVSSKLISPVYTVPSASQNPRLRFWHWYSLSSGDYGKVQIKVVGTTDWVDVSTTYTSTGSNIWTYPSIDLSDYAGKSIEIAFYFYSINTSFGNVSSGWYIDDIEVVTGSIAFNNPEDWENGIGDWASERGTWEVGAPSSGPGSAHNGIQCAATVLDGNYAEPVSSKLISPVYTVPSASQNPRLRFWHWYSLSSGDYGKVQIKVVGTTDWVDVSSAYYTSTSGSIWTYTYFSFIRLCRTIN